MYISDYGYAASDTCTSNLSSYNDETCTSNNWLYNIKKNARAHYPLGVVLIEECEKARICNFTAQQKAYGRKGRRQAPYRSNFPQAHRSMRWRRSLSSRFFPLRLALCRRICPYSSYRIPEALR